MLRSQDTPAGADRRRRYDERMLRLTLHPDSPGATVTGIDVEATRPEAGLLELRYVLRGSLGEVNLPPVAMSDRADELWRHTCFEAFVGVPGRDGYFEFNLAPTTAWAAHAFDSYRSGMRPADVAAPRIEVRRGIDRFELLASLDLNGLGLDDLDWRVGLSAVIEDADNSIAYWALAHPPGRPDFHHGDCFALELPETARP
jgi:hypothetical protein